MLINGNMLGTFKGCVRDMLGAFLCSKIIISYHSENDNAFAKRSYHIKNDISHHWSRFILKKNCIVLIVLNNV